MARRAYISAQHRNLEQVVVASLLVSPLRIYRWCGRAARYVRTYLYSFLLRRVSILLSIFLDHAYTPDHSHPAPHSSLMRKNEKVMCSGLKQVEVVDAHFKRHPIWRLVKPTWGPIAAQSCWSCCRGLRRDHHDQLMGSMNRTVPVFLLSTSFCYILIVNHMQD